MEQYKAIYGVEHSGHHYFGAFRNFDSGALIVALVLKMLAVDNRKASDLVGDWGKNYFLSGEINFKLTEDMTMDKIKLSLLENFSDGHFSYLDGISIFYTDWKVNIRFSNTEPLLRLNVETVGLDKVTEKVNLIKQVLNLN